MSVMCKKIMQEREYTIVEWILEEVNKHTYLFEGRKMPFNYKLQDQCSVHSPCAIKKSLLSNHPYL